MTTPNGNHRASKQIRRRANGSSEIYQSPIVFASKPHTHVTLIEAKKTSKSTYGRMIRRGGTSYQSQCISLALAHSCDCVQEEMSRKYLCVYAALMWSKDTNLALTLAVVNGSSWTSGRAEAQHV
jgi:hypothetical protein